MFKRLKAIALDCTRGSKNAITGCRNDGRKDRPTDVNQ